MIANEVAHMTDRVSVFKVDGQLGYCFRVRGMTSDKWYWVRDWDDRELISGSDISRVDPVLWSACATMIPDDCVDACSVCGNLIDINGHCMDDDCVTDPILTYRGSRCTTALQAAEEFAATWWSEPRRIRRYVPEPGPCSLAGRFSLVRGVRDYAIWYDDRAEAFAIRPV